MAGGMVAVGTYPPNEWGLYEMHGNVWEWCEDSWHPTYKGAPSDASAGGGDPIHRVLRGGYWDNLPENIRSAVRHAIKASISHYATGLRVAVDLVV
jgi:formylglycine-generating enzyme required for sulfatase activity